MQYLWAYVVIGVFVLLWGAVLLRRRYTRDYDRLVDASIPKNGGWYTTEQIHTYVLARRPQANLWSVFASLLRYRRERLVEGRRREGTVSMEWRWVGE